jgi:hypothetical protein
MYCNNILNSQCYRTMGTSRKIPYMTKLFFQLTPNVNWYLLLNAQPFQESFTFFNEVVQLFSDLGLYSMILMWLHRQKSNGLMYSVLHSLSNDTVTCQTKCGGARSFCIYYTYYVYTITTSRSPNHHILN